jgi:hypothetical protein
VLFDNRNEGEDLEFKAEFKLNGYELMDGESPAED